MKSILLLGNSHGGAIKMGLDDFISSNFISGVRFDSCLLPGALGFGGLFFDSENQKIRHHELTEIPFAELPLPVDVSNYSKIFLINGSNPYEVLKELARWQLQHDSLISDSLLCECFDYLVKDAGKLRSHILESIPSRCVYIGQPLRGINSNKKDADDPHVDLLHQRVKQLKLRMDDLLHRYIYSVVFPPSFLLDGLRTKNSFFKDGCCYRGGGTKMDYLHVNRRYGFELVKHIFSEELV